MSDDELKKAMVKWGDLMGKFDGASTTIEDYIINIESIFEVDGVDDLIEVDGHFEAYFSGILFNSNLKRYDKFSAVGNSERGDYERKKYNGTEYTFEGIMDVFEGEIWCYIPDLHDGISGLLSPIMRSINYSSYANKCFKVDPLPMPSKLHYYDESWIENDDDDDDE